MFELFYHPIYTYGIDKNSTFPRDRYRITKNYLDKQKVIINFQKPNLAKVEDIILGHEKKYVTSFIQGLLTEKEKRRIGLQPWNEHIVNRTRYILGGSIGAMKSAIERNNIAGNMAGGTHHAHFSYGSGYCIFNDLAICALKSIKDYKNINKVLIIDLDVHQGMFQNLDPKYVTFFYVLRHFSAHKGQFKYQNRNLHKIAVILGVGLMFYVHY